MTYNKRHKSYKKGKGRSRRRSSFDGNLLRALPTLIFLVSGGLILMMNLDLGAFLFPQNKTELNEKIVKEIEEKINTEGEIKTIKKMEFDEEVFTIVQEMPRFSGCEDLDISIDKKKKCAEKKMLEFIYERIKIPQSAVGKYSGDLIVISFIIDKEGNVIEPKVLRGDVEEMNEIILNIVKSMPQWIPGKQDGKPVKVEFNLPIRTKPDY